MIFVKILILMISCLLFSNGQHSLSNNSEETVTYDKVNYPSSSNGLTIFNSTPFSTVPKGPRYLSKYVFTGSNAKILYTVRFIISLIIIIGNIIGNSFIIATMTRPTFKEKSIGIYFTALALSDISQGVFGDLQPFFPQLFGFDAKIDSNFSCQLSGFVPLVSMQLSGYFLSAIAVDRLIAIYIPHKAKVCKTIPISNSTSVRVALESPALII